jgi:hypothetical protein
MIFFVLNMPLFEVTQSLCSHSEVVCYRSDTIGFRSMVFLSIFSSGQAFLREEGEYTYDIFCAQYAPFRGNPKPMSAFRSGVLSV